MLLLKTLVTQSSKTDSLRIIAEGNNLWYETDYICEWTWMFTSLVQSCQLNLLNDQTANLPLNWNQQLITIIDYPSLYSNSYLGSLVSVIKLPHIHKLVYKNLTVDIGIIIKILKRQV